MFDVLESDVPRIYDHSELAEEKLELETTVIEQHDLPPDFVLTDPDTGYLRKFNSDQEITYAVMDLA